MSEPRPREGEGSVRRSEKGKDSGGTNGSSTGAPVEQAGPPAKSVRDSGGPNGSSTGAPVERSGAPALPPAKSVHRCTPQPVLDLVYEVLGAPVGIDPCSNPRSIVQARRNVMLPEDGLQVSWHEYETGFVNPPFGKVEEPRWIQKAIQEAALGWEGILLLPSKTGAPWFEPLYQNSPCICLWGTPELDVEGRIWFHEEDAGATFNTEIVYLGPRYERFARVFSRAGHLFYPRHDQALTTRITGRTMPTVYAGAHNGTGNLFENRARVEREIRATRYHGFSVGVTNLPPETTIKDALDRDDMPELRAIIESLTLHDLGQSLLLLSNEPDVLPPATTRRKAKRTTAPAPAADKNQLGLPVHADGRAHHSKAERDRFDAHVLQTIMASHEPLARAAIVAVNPCTNDEYRSAIKRLKKAGQIKQVGDGRHTRYRGAPTPPRTEQDE